MRRVGHIAAAGTGQLGGNPAVGRDMAFEEEDAPRMLGTDDLGGVTVERRQLAPLVAPGLIQEVVADHAWGLARRRRKLAPASAGNACGRRGCWRKSHRTTGASSGRWPS